MQFSKENPVSIMELVHDGREERNFYVMRCRNHPDLEYTSKNPRFGGRILARTAVCECSWVELEVIGRESI